MVLSKTFQQVVPSTPGNFVNYSYLDIATGTGYVDYYAGTASGAEILSNLPFYSDEIESNALITNLVNTIRVSKSFDLLFNVPQNVRGDAIVEVPIAYWHLQSPAYSANSYIVAVIKRWDGTTETDIAEGSSGKWEGSGGGIGHWSYRMRTAKITIPYTHFKAGEYLRLTVHVHGWAGVSGEGANQVIMGHSPNNQSNVDGEIYSQVFASGASILKLQLPLKIDT